MPESMWIDGEGQSPAAGRPLIVQDPATAETVAELALPGPRDVDRAVAAAQRAWPGWARTPGPERQRALERMADALAARAQEIGEVLSREQGKPYSEAVKEAEGAAEAFRYYAAECVRPTGYAIPGSKASLRDVTRAEPVGVVAAISPWNYPVLLMAWKVAPALAAGCTVVAKPPPETPLSPLIVGQIASQVLAPGVLNVLVGGPDVGEALVRDPRVRAVTFTGSTATGRRIARLAAESFTRVTLEMGGQCPALVFADADVERAAREIGYRAFRNAGQICNAVNRIFVDRRVADRFVAALGAYADSLRLGPGLSDPEPDLGPMTTAAGLERVRQHVADALAGGARLVTGGQVRSDLPGQRFFAPTVLEVPHVRLRVMQEETFGPVAPVLAMDDMDDAIREANALPYGLVGYVYTTDLATAVRAGEALEVGTVGVNNVGGGEVYYPYEGYKDSGLGWELGPGSLEPFVHRKHIRLAV